MRRTSLLALALLGSTALPAFADEGMWTYDNFPTEKMKQALGWAPDEAWLKHAQLSSLRLAQGCSASFISPDGLVMTNHHCARECIGGLSTAEHDYVADGFLAAEQGDEKRCPELEVNQLTDISDATKSITDATQGKSGREFRDAERAAIAKVEAACGTSSDVRCQVVTLYHGGVYDLYKYRRYQDVRLVWAVEDSAANFGGDPDNFNYPRYAIDAAFVRVYDNGKPLHTDNYLKFSPDGIKDGGITMVSGNPGATERELTVAQLEYERDDALPAILGLLHEYRGVLTEYGTKGAEQQRTSLSDLFFVENSLKALTGREQALVQGSLIPDKEKAQQELRQKVDADPKLAAARDAWGTIDKAVAREKQIGTRFLMEERMTRFSDLLGDGIGLVRYAAEKRKPNGERLQGYTDAEFPQLKQRIDSPAPIFPELQKTILTWYLTKLREYLGADDPDVHTILGRQSPAQIADQIVSGTKLMDAKARADLLAAGPDAIDASQDPLLVFARRLDGPARAVREIYENEVKAPTTQAASEIAKARFALYGTSIYPDATFTARLSYGVVKGYEQNGKQIPPFTTFEGAFARETGAPPFKLPESWTKAKDSLNLSTHLDMVTTNDIIGGNSGSPVIDRNGDAVGLVFDGNIQSLGGDFGYDPAQNRTVAVDITGLREALQKIYHADRIVKELQR